MQYNEQSLENFSNGKCVICSKCNNTFTIIPKNHQTNCKGIKNKAPYTCSWCGRDFKQRCRIMAHIKGKCNKIPKTLDLKIIMKLCNIPEKNANETKKINKNKNVNNYHSATNIINNIYGNRSFNNNIPPNIVYKCEHSDCGNLFTSEQSLFEHYFSIFIIYKCDYCYCKFENYSSYIFHKKIMHNDINKRKKKKKYINLKQKEIETKLYNIKTMPLSNELL